MEMHGRFCTVVLGSTGAVGSELLSIFAQRNFPVGELRLLASERSAGSRLEVGGRTFQVMQATEEAFQGVEIAFFSAGAERSRRFAPVATAAGAVVIDNSSAFRMNQDVPLVVPEINSHSMGNDDRLIANPNCTAAIAAMAIAPLARLGRLSRVVLATYQSASGGGAALMDDLREQTRRSLADQPLAPAVSPHPYAFNLFSHNTPVGEDGYNEEESKVMGELRKILERPDLRVGVTCVRVPVLRAHSIAATLEFDGPAPGIEEARAALASFPGVRLVDDRKRNVFPMPSDASGIDEVLVGRLRRDLSHPSAICLFVCGDQLRKGAALNAVQIAEHLIASGRLSSAAKA